jgi:hypothetical protein
MPDLTETIITVIIGGAVALTGINVMSSITSTMGLSSGDSFYNASQELQDGVGTFFSQLPTVFIVLALVLIISYLVLLRR